MSEENLIKNIFSDEDARFDGSSLSNSKEVSFVGEEDETGDFIVTLDLAKFDSLIEIVRKVLNVKGYAVNLENMLAMLDQFQIGIRATVENSEQPPYQITSYNYCFKLSKPNPQIQGDLIKVFYSEVKKYQKEIIKLKTDLEDVETKNKTQTIKELRDEIKRLQNENTDLNEKNKTLNQRIENSVSSIRSSGGQDKSWLLEDGELRLAKITAIDLVTKQLSLKSAQSSFRFDLSKVEEVPSIGSTCLAHIIEGTIQKLFLVDNKSTAFKLSTSTVLISSKEGLKVRDSDRNILIIKLRTREDYVRAEGLCRGMPVLLYKYQNRIIKWVALKEKNHNLELKMEETVLCHQFQKESQS